MSETTPRCLTLLLCDQVIEDKRTSKKSLIGTFNDILALRVPFQYPLMSLFISLTDCRGEHQILVDILRDNDTGGERVLQLHGKLETRNPLDVIDIVFELRGVPMPAYGSYTIELRIMPENERIAQRRFYVRPAQKPAPQPPAENTGT